MINSQRKTTRASLATRVIEPHIFEVVAKTGPRTRLSLEQKDVSHDETDLRDTSVPSWL